MLGKLDTGKKWHYVVLVSEKESLLSLDQLAAASGFSPRTIRYYISRGLVPRPRKAGPGACYGPEHLQRLEAIRQWQSQGLTLVEIAQRLAAPEGEAAADLPRSPWWAYPLAPDVLVYLRADVPPWRAHRLRHALAVFAKQLGLAPGPGAADASEKKAFLSPPQLEAAAWPGRVQRKREGEAQTCETTKVQEKEG